jgi:DNA-binding CsgD family transcriptional regulator
VRKPHAGLKLREAGEESAVEQRCADYYRSRCMRSLPEARYRLVEWLDWMDLEIDNIRAVLRRCVARQDHGRGLDLASHVGWYWVTRATTEGVRWLDELIGADPRAPAHAYFMRGFLAVLQYDPAAAMPALERAATAADQAGQASLRSLSLSMGSIAAHMAGDHPAAKSLLDTAQVVAAGLDDFPAAIGVLQAQALNGLFEGDVGTVRSAAAEGVRRSREVGDLYSLDMMLLNLGCAALVGGDLDEVEPLLTEALRIARRLDDRVAQYVLLDALGCYAAGCGQPRRAARLLGAARTVRTSAGANVLPHLASLVAQATETTTAALGDPAFRAEYDTGRHLSRKAAIAQALGEPARTATATSTDRETSPLGKREAEVARLVAEGLSNKQIGARLLISEHTVDTHIRSILNKLGFNSRAQIAAWMTSADR